MADSFNQKKTYSGLDLAKFLCAILILFYHFFTEHQMLPSLLEEALSAYAIAVALFMVISGFLTFNKIEKIDSTAERWKVVKKQVLRILRVYAIWSVVYILYNIYSWDWTNISFVFVLRKIRHWVFSSTFYTIWFMPSLAVGLILTFWITEKFPKKIVVFLAVVLFVLGAFGSTIILLSKKGKYFKLLY